MEPLPYRPVGMFAPTMKRMYYCHVPRVPAPLGVPAVKGLCVARRDPGRRKPKRAKKWWWDLDSALADILDPPKNATDGASASAADGALALDVPKSVSGSATEAKKAAVIAYVINMAPDEERLRGFRETVERNGEGIVATWSRVEAIPKTPKMKWTREAIALSHAKAMRAALRYTGGCSGKGPDVAILILEDDVEFLPKLADRFRHAVRSLPDDWDVLHLGLSSCESRTAACETRAMMIETRAEAIMAYKGMDLIESRLLKIRDTPHEIHVGGFATLYRRRALPLAIQLAERAARIGAHQDVVIHCGMLERKRNMYVVVPFVCHIRKDTKSSQRHEMYMDDDDGSDDTRKYVSPCEIRLLARALGKK